LGKCSLESSGIPISQAYQDQASIGTATIFETPSSWAFTWNKSLKLNMSDDFCAWEKKNWIFLDDWMTTKPRFRYGRRAGGGRGARRALIQYRRWCYTLRSFPRFFNIINATL
jgi:hypothetical protein